MQQQGSKAKTPKKKGAQFFFGNPFFDQFFSKTLILHHPLKTVHKKISQNPYCYRLKKGGQVIDTKVAKLLTLQHIYIYVSAVKLLTGPSLGFLNVTNWAKLRGTNWTKVIFNLYL